MNMLEEMRSHFRWNLGKMDSQHTPKAATPENADQKVATMVAKAVQVQEWDGHKSEVKATGKSVEMSRSYPHAMAEPDPKDVQTYEKRKDAVEEWKKFWYMFSATASLFNMFPDIRTRQIEKLRQDLMHLDEEIETMKRIRDAGVGIPAPDQPDSPLDDGFEELLVAAQEVIAVFGDSQLECLRRLKEVVQIYE